MDYESLNLMDGDVLTSHHIRHIESGIREVENEIDSIKSNLVNILKNKSIDANESESFDDLYNKMTHLEKKENTDYEYTGDVIDVTDSVESGQIKIVYSDGNDGNVSFNVYATTGVTIDWGDGNIETYSTNTKIATKIYHQYIKGTGEPYTDVATQFVATISPVVPNGITGLNVLATYASSVLGFASKDVTFLYGTAVMFGDCKKLEYINMIGGAIGSIDVTISLKSFCGNCYALKYIIANVVWESVSTCFQIFYNCYELENISLGDEWNSYKSESFESAFGGCKKLKVIPSFKTNNTVTMLNCCINAVNLVEVKGIWDLSKCNSFCQTFYNNYELTKPPILKNLYNIQTFKQAFYNCKKLVKFRDEQGKLDTEICNDFSECFLYCGSLEEVVEIDVSSVETALNMFKFCRSLYILQNVFDFKKMIGTKISYTVEDSQTAIDSLFEGCTSLITSPTIIAPTAISANNLYKGDIALVNVPDINLPECLRSVSLFEGCIALKQAPNIYMPKCQNIKGTFKECSSLKYAPCVQEGEVFEFPEAILACEMFKNCISLLGAPYKISLPKALEIYSMFYSCSSLVNAPKEIYAPLAKKASSLFYGNGALRQPPERLDFPEAINLNDTFKFCSSLLVCAEINAPKAQNLSAMYYGCNSLTSTIPYNFPSATTVSYFYYQCYSLMSIDSFTVGDAVCIIEYFAYDTGSSLRTAYFPEGKNGVVWNVSVFNTNTSFKKFKNIVDVSRSNSSVNNILKAPTIEEIKLNGLYFELSVTNRTQLSSIRLFKPSKDIGNLNFYNNKLDTDALNQLFEDLPAVDSTRTINVKGNPGSLTCDPSIAQKKNWVVTVI